MNKIYTRSVRNFKSIVLIVFGLMFFSVGVKAQVTVGATPYTTLKAAFDAINIGTHTGAITININANTTETATAVLNGSGTGSASYTSVLIQPTVNSLSISGDIFGADIIQLNGADNVTINGLRSGGATNLTITNTSSSGGPGVIWISSVSASNGATNNTIQNCNITGASSTASLDLLMSSGSVFGGIAEAANSNNRYLNNIFSTATYGVVLVGPSGNETGTIVSGNTINATSAHSLEIYQQQGVSITQNTISGNSSTITGNGNSNTGIYVSGTISGGLIQKNIINNIKKSGPWGCSGILLNSSSAASNLTIANNFIYDIAAGGFTSSNHLDDNGFGIAIYGGGGYNIYYNSINLNSNQTNNGISAACWISQFITTASSLNIRDNIFSNQQTTGTRYSIYSDGAVSNVFSSINYNDYYTTGSSLGFLGGAQTNLANWQSATGQDANSVSVDPSFTTGTNLHLLLSSALDGTATPIGGITTDIDGDTRNITTPDIGADEFIPTNCTTNSGGTVAASFTNICPNTNVTLTATGYPFGLGISYQWQYDNGGGWTNLAGQTSPGFANPGLLTITTNFRLKILCSSCCGATPGYSVNTVMVTVTNPQVSGTTPASICGTGSLSLAATASSGTLTWYTNPTGGTPIFTGSPFITPVISSTTTYYVSNTIGGGAGFVGALYSGTSTNSNNVGSHGIAITTTQPNISINSVDIPFTGTGTITIALKDVSNSTVIATYTTGSVTGTGTTALTIPITLSVATAGNYLLIVDAVSGSISNLGYVGSASYPYSALAGAFTITSGYWYATTASNMYLFNLNVSNGCEGSRTAVTATITAPPALSSVTPVTPTSICGGGTVNLNAAGASYTNFVWNPGNLAGAAQSVSPGITTTYTLTATNATCRRDSSIQIIVNPTPTALTVTPASATICGSATTPTPITATGGTLVGQTIHSELFETFPLTQYTQVASGVTVAQNTTYFQQGSSSALLTHINNANGSMAMSSSINLNGYSSPTLSFYHICATEVTAGTHYDFGFVEYSIDGGTNWTSFPTSSYGGSGTLQNGVVSFDKASYPDWDAQFSSASSTPGTGPATALWKLETINLSTWAAQSNFRVRFRVQADGSIIYFGWLIDNIKITGNGQAPVTWSPITNLWTNVGLTIPYTAGTPLNTVYSNTPANITYTATATGGVSCTTSNTSTLTVSALPASVGITANPATATCAGEPITFTASTIVNGGGNPAFQWLKNGVTDVGTPTGYNPGASTITLYGLANGDQITCKMASSAGGCVPASVTSNIITVTINPKPSVSINGPLTVCFPTTLMLTTTGTITTYQWFLDGLSTGGNTSTLNATGPGTYTCIVTSNLGCKDTSAPKVLVQQTYTITSTATNGTISPSGPTVVNCGANQVFTYTANPGYQVCDVYIDGGPSLGALASPYTFTNVTSIHTIDVVFCVPGCPFVYSANAGATTFICANQTYTLGGSISCTPANGSFAATWSTSGTGTFNGGAVFGVATTYTPSAADIAAGIVFLTLTTNNPGGASCAAASSSMQLRIRPLPTVSITGQLGICSAGTTSTLLTAVASIPAGTITGYQWYNITTSTSLGTASTQSVNTAGDYRVTVTANNTCTNIATVTVVNFPTPAVSISPVSPITVCQGVSATLTANPSGGSGSFGANSFVWYNPAVIGGAVTNTLTAAASGSPYSVTVQDNNGCLSNASSAVIVSTDVSPLNGAYTIGLGPASCTNYVSIAAAITDLNNRSISGSVRFDIPAGYIETLTSTLALGSATLNAAVAGKTITFQKSGTGTNPLIIAQTGTAASAASANPDGIWSLRGVDNVSILSIDLKDNNATSPGTMEYGFGLFKLGTAGNNIGAQGNTIQNCVITLKRTNDVTSGNAVMPDGSTAIAVINALATAANAALTPTIAGDAHSNNKFYGNTIQNCNTGIALLGFATTNATLGDAGNDVGGNSGATGNSILNYGGGSSSTAVAVRARDQWGVNISYNTINNNNGSGINHPLTLYGIYGEAGASAAASTSITNNTITVTSAATTSGCYGISNAIGGSNSSNTISINNNNVICKYASATSGSETGIQNVAAATTVNINNNTLQNCTFTGTGGWTGINNNNGSNTTVNMNDNILQNCVIAGLWSISTNSGTYSTGIGNTLSGATNLNINNSIISGNSRLISVTGTGNTINWIQGSNVASAIFNNNNISGNSIALDVSTTQNFNINMVSLTGASTSAYVFTNNTVYNNSVTNIPGAIVVTLSAFSNNFASGNETLSNNIIRKLISTGTSTGLQVIHGLYSSTSAASIKSFSNNLIDSIYCSSAMSATIYGVRTVSGTTINIFKNKIHSLFPGQSATSGSYAAGIRVQSGTTVNVYNNFINLNLAQAFLPAASGVLTGTDALKGIEIAAATATTNNLYYNTIRLAGTGFGANFGSSAIGVTNATPNVDMRNNILINLATPGGSATGLAVAYRRPAAVSGTYASTSNNNFFYAGVASSSNLLYHDGTTGYQDIATYKAGSGINPRETASLSTIIPADITSLFVNVVNPIDLHIDPANGCIIDGAGANIATYTTDYDGGIRDLSLPDIGADEFSGTGSPNWRGRNTDWMNVNNWCGVLPTAATDVVIPNGVPNYPIITTTAPVAKSITIANTSSVTINPGGKLTVNSHFANSGTLTNNGWILLNGTSSQNFPGSGTVAAMDTLEVNNNGAGVNINKAFTITGELLPTLGTITLNANNITLRSTATKTARVGAFGTVDAMGNYVSGAGRFVVERYVATGVGGSLHGKTWQFLAVPTKGDFLKTSWMENNVSQGNTGLAGYGTIITSEKTGAAPGRGYDFVTTPGPSMKVFNTAAQTGWISVDNGIANTSAVLMDQPKGYMVFVRGERSVQASGTAATPTTLRTTGKLYAPGTDAPLTVNIGANQFESVGNPYASAIDFTLLTRGGGTENKFYVWDPSLSGSYGYGGFQTISSTALWIPSPAGTVNYPATAVQTIQSGQAFFVHATAAGTLGFSEAAKVNGNKVVFKPSGNRSYIRTSLFTNTGIIADGHVTAFDADFSNGLDGDDALKMMNQGENLGSMYGGNRILSIEARSPVVREDTIFYTISNLRKQAYEFRFAPENMQSGLEALLVDKYLNTKTGVSLVDDTNIGFEINDDAASAAADRFMLVFKSNAPVPPVKFASIDANKQNKDILVDWKIQNELNIHHYEVEKSADGVNFTKATDQAATGNGTPSILYNWLDTNPWSGDNFYRVRSVGVNGDFKYSLVVKVNMPKMPSAITLYPNPVQEDRVFYVNFSNKTAGNYVLKLANTKGQQIMSRTINHQGGNNVYPVTMDKARAHGNYLLTITGDDHVKLTFKVVY